MNRSLGPNGKKPKVSKKSRTWLAYATADCDDIIDAIDVCQRTLKVHVSIRRYFLCTLLNVKLIIYIVKDWRWCCRFGAIFGSSIELVCLFMSQVTEYHLSFQFSFVNLFIISRFETQSSSCKKYSFMSLISSHFHYQIKTKGNEIV